MLVPYIVAKCAILQLGNLGAHFNVEISRVRGMGMAITIYMSLPQLKGCTMGPYTPYSSCKGS